MLFVCIGCAALLASGCGGERSNRREHRVADQNLTAETPPAGDTTAIDAATGADANMAADFEIPTNAEATKLESSGRLIPRLRTSGGKARPSTCASAAKGANAGGSITQPDGRSSASLRASQSIGWTRKFRKSQLSSSAGRSPAGARRASVRRRCAGRHSVPALGLTHSQSIPRLAGSVPLLSTAMRKARWCSARSSAGIELEHGLSASDDRQSFAPSPHVASTWSASALGRRTCPRLRHPCRRIRVAEIALGRRPILLAPGPEVAAGEAQENGATARSESLHLEA